MITSYNRIAGQSVERLAALSDGIFGVAMTLLAIDLHVPARELIHHEHELRHELLAISPEVLVYLMSFLTLGIFWVGQQSQLNHLRRSDIRLTWIHLAFLFAVTLMPFSTKLLAAHHAYRTALLEYWGNILIFGVMLYASWGYATRVGLVKDDISPEVPAAVCRRIIIGQAWYAFGAVLCSFSTYLSMLVIVSVQLFYILSPWLRLPHTEDAPTPTPPDNP
jgi:TMEM175 potassium channel family protein